ncbi:dihydrofolate reductase family protein [Rhodococcus aerolatus]
MRLLTAGLFHSVDGVVESPHLWQLDAFDDELGAAMGAFISATGTAVLGRVGYEQWSQHFPTSDDPFAGFINPVEKLVASRTLSGPLQWQNARLIEGDAIEALTALKQGDGPDVALVGGVSLVRQCLFAGILDRLTLMTHPVVAGAGRHLFEPGDPVTPLELVGLERTSRGNVLAEYRLAPR